MLVQFLKRILLSERWFDVGGINYFVIRNIGIGVPMTHLTQRLVLRVSIFIIFFDSKSCNEILNLLWSFQFQQLSFFLTIQHLSVRFIQIFNGAVSTMQSKISLNLILTVFLACKTALSSFFMIHFLIKLFNLWLIIIQVGALESHQDGTNRQNVWLHLCFY